ncbi:MAG: dihydrodipicolinate synthase family protein [Planctomycetaceae bacterium]|nr:MAG: dihydrodipicolinate synthase family protein [Planctomycetaceae bacterium]
MDTRLPDAQKLRDSVIAVPPLAVDADGNAVREENAKVIRHITSGGVSHLLYGGNALFYHVRPSRYSALLEMLSELTDQTTSVVPSVGPAYGLMMDQVEVLREFDFPTAMVLPQRDIVDDAGIASGIRHAAEKLGKPLVVYIKFDRWLSQRSLRSLESDGVVSWVKYAVVRDDPSDDRYLSELLEVFPAERMISGIGEQPAIEHVHGFGLGGFTSGCVCVHPSQSQRMLRAIQADELDEAAKIRKFFEPLEDLRNEINPIRVLHDAVRLAGIAETGPLLPLVSPLEENDLRRIRDALRQMSGDAVAS